MRRHPLVAVALAMVIMGLVSTPAAAATGHGSGGDRQISVSGGVIVAQGETVNGPVVSFDGDATINGVVTDDVLVGRGNVRINGRVSGDVLVLDGDAVVTGTVLGDVITVVGRVIVQSGAHVSGDVVSRREPRVASRTVRGEVKRLNLSSVLSGFLITFLIFLWIAVTIWVAILGLLFVLVFPRAADAAVAASRRVWPSLGWGALVSIVGPIIGVVVLATVVGIPFGLGMLSALTILSPLGYVTASLSLGRRMVKGTSTGARIGAFFAGFGILRAAALIPGIGFIVWFLACLYGVGALTIAAWRAGHAPAPLDNTEPVTGEPISAAATTQPDAIRQPDPQN